MNLLRNLLLAKTQYRLTMLHLKQTSPLLPSLPPTRSDREAGSREGLHPPNYSIPKAQISLSLIPIHLTAPCAIQYSAQRMMIVHRRRQFQVH